MLLMLLEFMTSDQGQLDLEMTLESLLAFERLEDSEVSHHQALYCNQKLYYNCHCFA